MLHKKTGGLLTSRLLSPTLAALPKGANMTFEEACV